MPNITIAGGGFAGVWSAMAAAATRHYRDANDIEITLVSKDADLCIRPRLYERPRRDMLVPLKPLLDAIGVHFRQEQVAAFADGRVQTSCGHNLDYDRLILALGSHVAVPNIPLVHENCFTVDTFDDTVRLDQNLAKIEPNSTVVVVGAGFSGLEIATQLRKTLGDDADIVLLDQAPVAGQSLGSTLTGPIAKALDRESVRFMGGETPARMTTHHLHLTSGTVIETGTVIFATGLRPSALASGLGVNEPDGRLKVGKTLQLPDMPSVFAAGDVAAAWADDAHQTLMSCQHAMPMGTVAGQNAVLDLLGADLVRFEQRDYATCLSLGSEAIFTRGWDRTIALTGAEGAAMKTQINETWIYPPKPSLGRDAIFAAVLPASV